MGRAAETLRGTSRAVVRPPIRDAVLLCLTNAEYGPRKSSASSGPRRPLAEQGPVLPRAVHGLAQRVVRAPRRPVRHRYRCLRQLGCSLSCYGCPSKPRNHARGTCGRDLARTVSKRVSRRRHPMSPKRPSGLQRCGKRGLQPSHEEFNLQEGRAFAKGRHVKCQ